MIRTTNGLLVFDESKERPPDQDGYIRDEHNPYVFHPIVPKCKFRQEQEYIARNCGCKHKRLFCDYYKKKITILKCLNCEVREE